LRPCLSAHGGNILWSVSIIPGLPAKCITVYKRWSIAAWISDAAENIGVEIDGRKNWILRSLINDAMLPAIIYWDQYSFRGVDPVHQIKKAL
jgi:hypothetical protein